MGYDYSGGGLNGPNRHMAEFIRMLRAGETRGQQRQALMDRAMMVGATAGIGAIGHALEGRESVRATGERNAARAASAQKVSDAGIRQSSEQYAAPDYDPSKASAMGHTADVPAWLTAAQGESPGDIQAQAKEATDTQAMNKAAAGAPIGGIRTPGALDSSGQEADVRAADISTGKNLMNAADTMDDTHGGMARSLRRR